MNGLGEHAMNQSALRAHLRVNDLEFKMSPVSMVEFFTRCIQPFLHKQRVGVCQGCVFAKQM